MDRPGPLPFPLLRLAQEGFEARQSVGMQFFLEVVGDGLEGRAVVADDFTRQVVQEAGDLLEFLGRVIVVGLQGGHLGARRFTG